MAAGRLRHAATIGVAVCGGLLAAASFGRCSLYKEYVRRGAMVDTLVARVDRLEQAQLRGNAQVTTLRADLLTETEALGTKLDNVDARVVDLTERLERVSRKLGLGRGVLAPNAPDTAHLDTGVVAPDTTTFVLPDSPPQGVDPDRLYNNAYLDFTRAKYEVAIAGFRQYLELFAQSEMADNALYWVGECHYSLGRVDSAAVAFRQVLTDYPDGNKAPAAAYKLGLVYQAQGRHADAQRQFADVVNRWPRTPEANLAKDRLKQQ